MTARHSANQPNSMELFREQDGLARVRLPDGGSLLLMQVLGIGRNYAEHAAEQGVKAPDRPMVFSKSPASIIFDGEEIMIPPICRDPETGGPDQVDFEAELAVIIGKPTRDVPESKALDAVLGYCCGNDVSARWWQKQGSGGQFCRGKSFDSFCPLGPRVIPAAQVDPTNLRVTCRVGPLSQTQVMQDDTTASMLFPVAKLIAELSRGTTLLPGTVIMTGTPSGVGMARTPPRYLRAGEYVEVEIEGLGILRNPVMHE